jgi:hypothetical protein
LTLGENQTARCQRIWQAHWRDSFDPLRAALRNSRHATPARRLIALDFFQQWRLAFSGCTAVTANILAGEVGFAWQPKQPGWQPALPDPCHPKPARRNVGEGG